MANPLQTTKKHRKKEIRLEFYNKGAKLLSYLEYKNQQTYLPNMDIFSVHYQTS